MKMFEKWRYELALKDFFDKSKDHVPPEVLSQLDFSLNVIQTYEKKHFTKTFGDLFRNFLLNLITQFIGTTIASYCAIYVLMTIFNVSVELSWENSLLIAAVIYAYRTKFTISL